MQIVQKGKTSKFTISCKNQKKWYIIYKTIICFVFQKFVLHMVPVWMYFTFLFYF